MSDPAPSERRSLTVVSGMMLAVESLLPRCTAPNGSVVMANASGGGYRYSEPLNTPSVVRSIIYVIRTKVGGGGSGTLTEF